ncbi:hypothetical protein Tco_0701774, partial [Tanacetum coccineum]
ADTETSSDALHWLRRVMQSHVLSDSSLYSLYSPAMGTCHAPLSDS